MKILAIFEIKNGMVATAEGSKPHKLELNPELVTRRLMRRLVNADISVLHLDYEDPTTKQPVGFIAEMEEFQAVEIL